ncbi:hypothetical protein Sjap_009043 [Stephania japonica]|uniref:3'-5' exonuclease n=1 Tax=Stephania japonica TaxID=461633 RepID=A0AAP0JR73_9MAGN
MDSTIADQQPPKMEPAAESSSATAKQRKRKRKRNAIAHDTTTPLMILPIHAYPVGWNPVIKFEGRVVYGRTVEEVEKATAELLGIIQSKGGGLDGPVALGFDIEWKPTFQKGVAPRKAAVMQICVDASTCYVMHIIHSGIPSILQSLLEDPKYVKVGVSIADDVVKILKDYEVCVNSVEDLSSIADLKIRGDPKTWGLASLTERLTCKKLEKPQRIRLGNWEIEILSTRQLQYAATDAFVSWHLYQILRSFPDIVNDQNMEQGFIKKKKKKLGQGENIKA